MELIIHLSTSFSLHHEEEQEKPQTSSHTVVQRLLSVRRTYFVTGDAIRDVFLCAEIYPCLLIPPFFYVVSSIIISFYGDPLSRFKKGALSCKRSTDPPWCLCLTFLSKWEKEEVRWNNFVVYGLNNDPLLEVGAVRSLPFIYFKWTNFFW